MRDPFAFMGSTRGSGRPDLSPAAAPAPKPRFLVPEDSEMATACYRLLEALNDAFAPLAADDAVSLIACRFGFDCEPVCPGLWEMRYTGNQLVGFLKNQVYDRRRIVLGRPRMPFELLVATDGVEFA